MKIPSLHKYNMRYRGIPELDKHLNIANEIAHDLRVLMDIFDGNSLRPTITHVDYIKNNLLYVLFKESSCHSNFPVPNEFTSLEGDSGLKSRVNIMEEKIKFLSEQL